MPEFKDLALEMLEEQAQQERQDAELIKRNRQKQLKLIQDRIDKLLDMSLNNLITDTEYRNKKQSLEKERDEITLSLLDKQVDQTGLEPVKKVFEFLTDVVNRFKSADIARKREILTAFAKNITLSGGDLTITPYKWFEPIKDSSVGSILADSGLEAAGNCSLSLKDLDKRAYSQIKSVWLAKVVKFRTIF